MSARLSAFVIWSFVAGAIVFWAFRFGVSSPQAPAYAVPIERAAPPRGDLARLFGAPPVVAMAAEEAKPEAPSRFKLVGVMAPRSTVPQGTGAYGLALIAVDGKPARAFAVGARLDSDLVLQSVGLRTASLGSAQGGRTVMLEMPPLPAPATGVLPAPGAPATTVVPTVPVNPMAGMRPGTVPPPATPAMIVPQNTLPPQPVMQPQAAPVPPAVGGAVPPASPDNFRSQ